MIQLIIWAFIAVTLGVLEAFVFNKIKNIQRYLAFDVHVYLTALRIALIIPLMISVEERFMFGLIAVLIFPFLHDGFYYQTRKILSKGKIYKKGFFDRSTTTTAIISLSIFWRLIFFIFALGMVFVII